VIGVISGCGYAQLPHSSTSVELALFIKTAALHIDTNIIKHIRRAHTHRPACENNNTEEEP